MAHFGFDLDNTLLDYSLSCTTYAKLKDFPNANSIHELKNILRSNSSKEDLWTLAQSWLYGEGLNYVELAPGALDFLNWLLDNNWRISIHSHKSQFSPEEFGHIPLRQLMIEWFCNSPLKDLFSLDSNLFFYDDLNAKVLGIRSSNLNAYVDDLSSIFRHPLYPKFIPSYLYQGNCVDLPWLKTIQHFSEIKNDW